MDQDEDPATNLPINSLRAGLDQQACHSPLSQKPSLLGRWKVYRKRSFLIDAPVGGCQAGGVHAGCPPGPGTGVYTGTVCLDTGAAIPRRLRHPGQLSPGAKPRRRPPTGYTVAHL